MTARTALLLSALVLAACGPQSPADSDSDAASSSTDTTATTGATDSGATETGGEACPAADPAAMAALSIDFGGWPLVPDVYPERREVAAQCGVQSVAAAGGAIDIALLCSEGDLLEMPIALHVAAPADFAIDLVQGATVKLAGFWEGDAVDYVGGEGFVLRDAGDAILLAGLDYHGAGSLNGSLAPLSVKAVSGVCAPTCEGGCVNPEWDMVERRALDVADADLAAVQIVDRGRGELLAGGRRYDIVVDEAQYWSCLNCGEDYRWVLRGADQP